METNNDALSNRLNVNVSNDKEDLPMEIFTIAGEMFVYMNSCPPNYVNFYKYLLDERSVTDIILTTQNAIKHFHKGRFRQVSEKVFQRLANMMGFKFIKPDEQLKWRTNIMSVPGSQFLKT